MTLFYILQLISYFIPAKLCEIFDLTRFYLPFQRFFCAMVMAFKSFVKHCTNLILTDYAKKTVYYKYKQKANH